MRSADQREKSMASDKTKVLDRIHRTGVMPVLRAPASEAALALAAAIIEGGIDVIEVTMTVPNATELIGRLVRMYPSCVIGAGTVLDGETARACIEHGAQFIVSPAIDGETIKVCGERGVAAIPGALTPTEIVRAWKAGADLVKVFPASAMGGAAYLKSLSGPLPEIKLVPSGGVTVTSVREYLAAGAFAVGAGSDLADCRAIAESRPQEVTTTARAYRAAIEAFRAAQGGNPQG